LRFAVNIQLCLLRHDRDKHNCLDLQDLKHLLMMLSTFELGFARSISWSDGMSFFFSRNSSCPSDWCKITVQGDRFELGRPVITKLLFWSKEWGEVYTIIWLRFALQNGTHIFVPSFPHLLNNVSCWRMEVLKQQF
jgi:hypothetical protein